MDTDIGVVAGEVRAEATSSLVIRPALPVPAIAVASTLFSAIIFFAAGLAGEDVAATAAKGAATGSAAGAEAVTSPATTVPIA